jgi:predicted MFS family arabinose efflux permease
LERVPGSVDEKLWVVDLRGYANNGVGRLLWAWLSDAIGRRNVFFIMFLLQAALFFLMPSQREFAILVTLCFIVLSCFGGGFGTMPAFSRFCLSCVSVTGKCSDTSCLDGGRDKLRFCRWCSS